MYFQAKLHFSTRFFFLKEIGQMLVDVSRDGEAGGHFRLKISPPGNAANLLSSLISLDIEFEEVFVL